MARRQGSRLASAPGAVTIDDSPSAHSIRKPRMRQFLTMLLIALGGVSAGGQAVVADPAPACEIDRPVKFAGLNWASNAFHVSLARYILKHGYGCESRVVPGATLLLINGLGRGDVDVYLELYQGNAPEAWNRIKARGRARELAGALVPDATEGWYVPRYMIEGDKTRGIAPTAPGLKRVSDLPKYKALFRDPRDPAKGRFYNCMIGWRCEVMNSKKLEAYGLDGDFTNFRPGSGVALTAAIVSAYKRGKPILAYYWAPTWLLAKYDMVKLEEPAFDKAAWAKLSAARSGKGLAATAYPQVNIVVAANSRFAEQAPKLVAFFERYRTPQKIVADAVLQMREAKDDDGRRTALRFLRTRREMWRQWVPADVAARVEQSLK